MAAPLFFKQIVNELLHMKDLFALKVPPRR